MRSDLSHFYWILLIAIGISSPFGAAELSVRLSGLPTEAVYVGQQVRFTTTIFFTERPTGSPQFSVPEAEGGILLKLPDSPVYGREEVDGRSFDTWGYDFVFYPHRAGPGKIPPISVRATVGDQAMSGSTQVGTIQAILPPGAAGLSTLVSTTEFEVNESWQPKPGTDAKVGDAFTRTVTLKAPNILGMGFPPLPLAKPENLGVYPKNPTVDDKSARGDISGSRSETIVYVCEKEGSVTLPAMVIPWFDLDSKELKKVELPAISLKVAPNPAQQEAELEAAVTRAPLNWRAILLAAVALIGLGFAWIRFAPRLEQALAKRNARIEASERHLFGKLRSAAHRGDALATQNAAPRWLATLADSRASQTLTSFADLRGDKDFQEEVQKLQQHLFGNRPGTTEWKGGKFVDGLTAARKRVFKRAPNRACDLAPLNPNTR
jgi:hypothetical protein